MTHGVMLELFSGTGAVSSAFRRAGWEAYTVDWEADADLRKDIEFLTAEDVEGLCGRAPDVVWASPDCTTYSLLRISRHRRKEADGSLAPVSEYAEKCDRVGERLVALLDELKPRYWFIENPVGGMRKMPWMQGLPRYTVTYCQYGESRMKPTDIWTNHPSPGFLPPCRYGDPCHERAPRGSRAGTRALKTKAERARIPAALAEHIVEICNPPLPPSLTLHRIPEGDPFSSEEYKEFSNYRKI